MTAPAQVKGLVLANARDFCAKELEPGAWQRVLDASTSADRAELDAVVPVGWYDVGLYDRVHDTMLDVLGHGDPTVLVRNGHWSAERDLSTVHRLFARLATPSFLIAKHGEFWRRFQTSGAWRYQIVGERSVRTTLHDWASRSDATAIRLGAYLERFMEVLGAKGARVTRTRRGAGEHEFAIVWTSGKTTT